MRILLINDNGVEVGGAETYLINLKRGLQRAGHDVLVFTSDHNIVAGKNVFADRTFRAVNIKSPFRLLPYLFNLSAYFELRKVLREFKPDIVHLHFIFYHTSPSILLLLADIPTVMTTHAHEVIAPVGVNYTDRCNHPFVGYCVKCTGVLKYYPEKIKRIVFRILSKRIRLFITPSKYYQKLYTEHGYTPTAVVNNGIELHRERSVDAYKPGDAKILYMGRLAPEKDAATAVSAMTRVVKEFPHAVLTIVGTGPEESNLRAQIARLGLEKNISMTGHIENEKTQQYYRDATAVVVPSNYPDNFPTVCIEAMNYGKPIVASRIGGLPELVIDGENGMLFEPGNAQDLASKLIKLLKNPELVREYSKASYERVVRYDIGRNVQEILQIYSRYKR